MGKLVVIVKDAETDYNGLTPIDDQLYSKLCFEKQQSLKDKGHISKICVAKTTTASGNHIDTTLTHFTHARVTHRAEA